MYNKIKTLLNYCTKQSRPALSHVLITRNDIQATDLETSILFKSNYGHAIGVHSINTLGEYSKASESVRVDDLPMIDYRIKGNDNTLVNVKTLETLNKHASKDETRVHLNSICFDKTKVVATNGYHLKVVELTNELKEQYLISRESINVLVKLCKLFKVERVQIYFNDEFAIIDNDSFIITMRLIKREYIKYAPVIPQKFKTTISINNYPDMRVIKPFLIKGKERVEFNSNGTSGIKLLFGDNHIIVGESSDIFNIGFNPLYIDIAREGLKNFKLQFNSNLAPCLVHESIVMPLKL